MSLVDDADLVRIEHALNELSQKLRQSAPRQSGAADDPPVGTAIKPEKMSLMFARSWIEAYRARNAIFGATIFSDPAWSILLHLYVGEKDDPPRSISSLCVAANLAQSTGLRWVLALEKAGNVLRTIDPLDRRRTLVSLTSAARQKMERALV
jgi:DNA-binding MarR family transcriptional regulator